MFGRPEQLDPMDHPDAGMCEDSSNPVPEVSMCAEGPSVEPEAMPSQSLELFDSCNSDGPGPKLAKTETEVEDQSESEASTDPVQADAVTATSEPVQADAVTATSEPMQADVVTATSEPMQADAVTATSEPVQADQVMAVKGDEEPAAPSSSDGSDPVQTPAAPASDSGETGAERRSFVRGPTRHHTPDILRELCPPGCVILLNRPSF